MTPIRGLSSRGLLHQDGAFCCAQDLLVGGDSAVGFIEAAEHQGGHSFPAGLGVDFIGVSSRYGQLADSIGKDQQLGYRGAPVEPGESAQSFSRGYCFFRLCTPIAGVLAFLRLL